MYVISEMFSIRTLRLSQNFLSISDASGWIDHAIRPTFCCSQIECMDRPQVPVAQAVAEKEEWRRPQRLGEHDRDALKRSVAVR